MAIRRSTLIALVNGACLLLWGCSGTVSQSDSNVEAEIRHRCHQKGFDDAEPDDDDDGDEIAKGWKCVHRDGGTPAPGDMAMPAPAPDLATPAPAPDLAMPAPAPDLAMPAPAPDLAMPAPAISFSKQVQPIFTNNCAGCHGGNTFPTLTAGTSYSQLVNVTSKRCGTAKEVVPGQPAQSYLLTALTSGASLGTCSGGFMSNYVTSADLGTISGWIAEGAPNN